MSRFAPRRAVVLLLAAAIVAGCGGRVVRDTVLEEDGLEIFLRGVTEGGELVDRGFEHPATVAPVRVAHILGRVDVILGDDPDGGRVPAVPLSMIFRIGEGVSAALARAHSGQEVVVRALRRDRRWGIFTHHHFTSLVVRVRGGLLETHLGHIDWEVPKAATARGDKLPEPYVGKRYMAFRVVPTDGIVPVGAQGFAADWRSPRFADPGGLQITPRGVQRRTILLESSSPPAEETPEAAPTAEALPGSLAPLTLRRLADLEEARARGEITEGAYQARRRAILAEDPSTP